jgi:uncharacterized Zn-binding protein involved in type VI secretion
MPAAVRYGDLCTGHDTCRPRPNVQASRNVFINNLGAHRYGDRWTIHCLHSGNQASGSSDVYVNGLPQARVGDVVSCGSHNLTGSFNVYVNG